MPRLLSEILKDQGIPDKTIRQVITALERYAGPPTPRSRAILVRTARRQWQYDKLVHTRVGEDDGGEWFTISNIKL